MPRCVKGSVWDVLLYGKGEKVGLWGYSDANNVCDPKTKTGTPEFVMMSGGAARSWGSKLHVVVALNIIESDYRAITDATHEGFVLATLVGGDGRS